MLCLRRSKTLFSSPSFSNLIGQSLVRRAIGQMKLKRIPLSSLGLANPFLPWTNFRNLDKGSGLNDQ